MPTPTTPTVGDRIVITTTQPYNVTWDDDGDWCAGLHAVVLTVREEDLGHPDRTPYLVRIDDDLIPECDGQEAWVTGVQRADAYWEAKAEARGVQLDALRAFAEHGEMPDQVREELRDLLMP